MKYDERYYDANAQDRDRPALWFYERIWRHYCRKGPVLEFGCGVGYLARRLSRHAEVCGYEINPYALERFRINAPNAQLVQNFETIPDKSLGSIVALHVLEHIPDCDLVLIGEQFKRILRDDGRLLFVMPDRAGCAHAFKGPQWLAFTDETHVNLKTAEEWRVFFESSWQLKVVCCAADGYYDFPYEKSILGRFMGDGLRAARTLVQFVLARFTLHVGDGEAVIFLLEKRL